jgi:predicted ATPase
VQNAQLGSDGSNAAAVIGEWSAGDLARSEQLDAFLHRCVPEVLKVRAGPSATPGHQDLSFVHTRGQTFGPDAVSDGVLFFTALAMHLVDASPGIVLFIEEPETGIHPRRLRDVIDLMRQIVRERGCQIVMSTHSPVVLDVFRDEPEAIVLFRRDAGGGTETRVAAEAPRVVAALEDASPGELLETGYFDGAWD